MRFVLPPQQPMLLRLYELAHEHGFILYPAAYQITLTTGALVGRGSFVPDSSLGAFIVTTMGPAEVEVTGGAGSDADVEVVVRSGSRTLTEGRVRYKSAFFSAALYNGGQEFPAPIVVQRSDALQLEFTGPAGSTLDATQAILVGGYHVRFPDGRMAGEAADTFARAVMADGELFVGGIVTTNTQNDGFPVQMDTHIQRFVLRADNTFTLTNYRARVGNVDLAGGTGFDTNAVNDMLTSEAGLVMQGHIPLRLGERIDAYQIGSGGQIVALTLVGRRFAK